MRTAVASLSLFLCALGLRAADQPRSADAPPPGEARNSSGQVVAPPSQPAGRAVENLAGQVDTSRGEGRRNENVQVNLVDTNAARELNARIGASATIVEEFRADRGYFSAEYGNATTDPIHVSAQRGAGVHGSLFWSHTNSIFTARSFFQAGGVQPARRNQYGGTGSVAAWKGGFLTFTLSQDQNRGAVNGNVLIPLPSEREPLATDPAVRAVVIRLIGAYPNVSPNRTDIAARALNTNSLQSTNTHVASGQLTQTLGSRDRLALRYSFIGQQVHAFQFTKGQNPDTDNKNHNARITWNRIFSPTAALDVSTGFDRQGTLLLPSGDAVGPVYVNGLQGLGPPSVVPINRAINRFRVQSSFQQQRTSHRWHAGAGVTRQHYNGFETEDSRPTYQFRDDFGRSAIDNLRLGTASIYSQSFGIYARSFRNWELHAFAGDRWTISNRLNLSYGLRWEPWTRPSDAMGLSRLPFHSDWNNLGGNLGFAYRAPRGVVRGSFAVVDGQLFPITYGQDRLNPPYNFSVAILAPDILQPLKGLSAADLNGSGRAVRFDIDPNLATPYSYHYNLSWEADVARGWTARLGYVGSRTHKLFVTYQLNRGRPVDGIPFTTATTNLRRVEQAFYQKFYTLNGSRAYYDAGVATLTAPSWRGASFSASYWFSKSIDLGSDYAVTGGGQERWGQAGQTETGFQSDMKGLSNFDQPHGLLLQGAWDSGARNGNGWLRRLSRRWTLTSVLLLKSGTPFTVDSGSDSLGFGNLDGTNGDRPNIVDPSILGRTIGNPDTSVGLLPRSAFAYFQAPAQMAGNLARNTFRKGTIANWNASLSRTLSLPGDWSMVFSAEAINLSNTPQFAEPGKSLSSPNFGQISNTLNDGRTFRFALRMTL
jgi:hypothetical protein